MNQLAMTFEARAKRQTTRALRELARYLPRSDHRNRYLRSGMRGRDPEQGDPHGPHDLPAPHGGMELPPGATFDPNPQPDESQEKHAPKAIRRGTCSV